ncbi:MAG: ParB/RepB/Spo0J family partition protein [Ruminococcaceae bacterium]|nr:ParB/RepB/Spo0J family partition protein [Oscillospiraceae bacterium]
MAQRKGLGRGLNTMIQSVDLEPKDNIVSQLNIIDVEPNRDQPRKNFDKESLEALSGSIKEIGVILPIIVVKTASGRYQIIAGERRWRAAKLAGLKTIPAIVKSYDDKEAAEVALIENLQREDLNPIEEAKGYKSLMDGFSMTQEEISKRVGKSRSAVANSLRILNLPDEIIKYLITGEISQGHGRALLAIEDNLIKIEIAKRIIKEGLNVRQVEALVKALSEKKPKKKKKKTTQLDIEIKALEEKFEKSLSTKVRIKHGAKKGKIEIEYYGNDDLERIWKIFQ